MTGLADLPLADTPSSLLDGRLTVRLPAAARVEPRVAGLMAAPEAVERETRVVVDAGDQRLVLMAWELLARADGDLVAAAEKDSPPGTKVTRLGLGGDLRGCRVEPPALDLSREAIEVARADVADAAGLVLSVAVYVNPAAAQADAPGVQALARTLLDTLRAGPRTLDLSARQVTIADREVTLVGLLPGGWTYHAQPGPDFTVHRLQGIARLGEPFPRLGIYVGGHPRWMHEHGDAPFETLRGPLLGLEVEWRRWSPEAGGTMLEAMGHATPHTVIHVFGGAPDAEGLVAVREVAASLRRTR